MSVRDTTPALGTRGEPGRWKRAVEGASVAFHRDRGGQATISLTPVDDPSEFGVVPTFDDGRVEAFVEKPPKDEAPTNLINAGTYVLEPSVLLPPLIVLRWLKSAVEASLYPE